MSVEFEMDAEDVKLLQERMKAYPENAERKITEYLHGAGYGKFEKAIKLAMPVSGKHWNGKRPAAKSSKSIKDTKPGTNLEVTIGTAKAYQYLYFPDDGSNTKHHQGNQRFFEKGVEQQQENVVNEMLDLLKFES